MGQLVLVFTACSLLEGATCKEVEQVFLEAQSTPYSCMLYGQGHMAKWVNEHPNWKVVGGWRCGPAERMAAKV